MKKLSILSITIIVVLTLSLSLVACQSSETYEPTQALSSWLDFISDDTPITKIALPGTHDSGTVGMMPLAETQRSTIAEQLTMGVRYFDIRVSDNGKGGVIFHGPIKGTDFQPIADDIKAFMDAHPSEFLLLDFQHFDGDKAPELVYETLKSKGILEKAVSNDSKMGDIEFIDSLTLGAVRGKVLVFFGSSFEEDHSEIFRRNNDGCTIEGASLDSLYIGELHKKGSFNFVEEALPQYFEHIIEKNSGILVLQGQLTAPNLLTSPLSLELDHRDNMLAYVNDNIKNNVVYLEHVNVIMRDFIEQNVNKSTSIIALNYYKGNVKDTAVGDLKTLVGIN